MSYETCSGCNEYLVDVSIRAFNMNWHPTCLGCNVCGKDFSDGSAVQEGEDGFAYCYKDYVETFAPRCGGCGDPITGQCLNAAGKSFHPEHFACAKCKQPFPNGQFFIGAPYCEPHYYEASNLLCVECEKPIFTSKCISFEGRRYHPEHFRCNFCKKNLSGAAYSKQNGKPFCKPCHLKLYDNNSDVATNPNTSYDASSLESPSSSQQTVVETNVDCDVTPPVENVEEIPKDDKIICEGCGMIYTPGRGSEEAAHRMHHQRLSKRREYIPFTGWKDETIVKNFEDDGSRIIMISHDHIKSQSKKVQDIVRFIDSELGYVPSLPHWQLGQTIFLYINNKRVIGCIVAEIIEEASPLIPAADEQSSHAMCSKKKRAAVCGISRIWVHPKDRRKGVATRLLDATRSNLVYGCNVKVEQTAFTQPTSDGGHLFSRYTGLTQFLVYQPKSHAE
ncbi:hypothetical protein PROFUN_12576 [Planoprotostelium fungivorum]|uniref:LIM zinc-binding domain-containing protein n=1 Tax=Planoprotostelium fungivorum TaxID=1890364 RepID=A0A2P6N6V5_9EUKA|nr:hypothetical protein PROFUN_12576 [Planoprotostelium fungivorum]